MVLPSRDVTFMYNFGKRTPINGGFYLMRNTPNMRAFLDLWHATCLKNGLRPHQDDQRFLNTLFKERKRYNMKIEGGLFSTKIVSGGSTYTDDDAGPPINISEPDYPWVTSSLIAFHTIGHRSTETKLRRVEHLLKKLKWLAAQDAAASSSAAAAVHIWQRPCDRRAAEESCQSQ